MIEIEGEILWVLHLHDFGECEMAASGISADALELLGDVLFYACTYLVLVFGISHLFFL
jgi:hypothetical protein